MNGYTAASRAYTENSILTAPPERLVVMLYDGLGRFLGRAAAALREGDLRAATEPLHRAHAILDELLATLDFEAGEVAERLESIYLFSKRTLTEAQLAQDPEPVERVAGLLAVLRGAWAEVAETARPAAAGDLA
ncbi:MAG TPA: flagellar export chaperone FliS [Solirubrobacterales bacterium]